MVVLLHLVKCVSIYLSLICNWFANHAWLWFDPFAWRPNNIHFYRSSFWFTEYKSLTSQLANWRLLLQTISFSCYTFYKVKLDQHYTFFFLLSSPSLLWYFEDFWRDLGVFASHFPCSSSIFSSSSLPIAPFSCLYSRRCSKFQLTPHSSLCFFVLTKW